MSTPKVQPLLLPVLRAIADGTEHPVEEIRNRVAKELRFTDDHVKQSNYENHVAWALANFNMGKAIIKKRKGVYQIAERGKAFLASGVRDLTINEARNA